MLKLDVPGITSESLVQNHNRWDSDSLPVRAPGNRLNNCHERCPQQFLRYPFKTGESPERSIDPRISRIEPPCDDSALIALSHQPKFSSHQSGNDGQSPISPISNVEPVAQGRLLQCADRIAAYVARRHVIRGKGPLSRGNIEDQLTLRRQMKQERFQETIFVRDVLQHVKQKDDLEFSP